MDVTLRKYIKESIKFERQGKGAAHMSNETYKKLIIEKIEKTNDNFLLRRIYLFIIGLQGDAV